MSRPRHVFIPGLDGFLREELQTIPDARHYCFHQLFEHGEIIGRYDLDMEQLLTEAERRLDRAGVPVDAIVPQWDFPITSLVPLLQRRHGLPGPDPEALARCTNKYWSRRCQREAIPDCTPAFQLLDPFQQDAADRIELDFPVWIKPVKGFGSHLGFMVEDRAQLERALAQAREELPEVGHAYNDMQRMLLGPDHERIHDGDRLLVEEVISGREIAPEGSVHRGRIRIHGVIDMPRHRRSFDRYEYPALLDPDLERRVNDATERLIAHIGYNDGCFNVEFFHDAEGDRLSVIEINPRISQSHCYQFEQVDGISNHAVAIAVALGEEPRMPRGEGPYGCAAKCLLRRWEDGVVHHIPDDERLADIQRRHPDCRLRLTVSEDQRLSDLHNQDSYSYCYAEIYVAGRDREHMLERRRAIEAELALEFEPV